MIGHQLYNQWAEGPNIYVFHFALHNCGNCTGFDIFILGFGIALRVTTNL